jgi:outer membrane receptor protein involved in Fe transport
MKIAYLFCILIFSACASSNKSSTDYSKSDAPKERPSKDYSKYSTLADALRSDGVPVRGVGAAVTIDFRGINSITQDTRPLFVVDRIIMGRDYPSVNSAINTANINSIKILKGLSSSAKYGEDGNSGVIEIVTKTAAKDK